MSGPALGRLGAVVVNYEAGPALLTCVASLRRAGVEEIAVVDNGSRDGSLAALAAADPRVRLVPEGRNLGYGTGANRGIERLASLVEGIELFLVCNPDVEVDPGAVTRLVGVLDRRPETAVAGPALYWPSGERYPSARAFPSYTMALAHGLLGMFLPDNPWSRRYRGEQAGAAGRPASEGHLAAAAATTTASTAATATATATTAGRPAGDEPAVDWVSGACFVVRRSAFESVGGFDEGYFMYVEDLDLCWRLRRAGWEVRYVPAARAVHAQGLSANRHPYRMLVAHHRSTWRFARRRASGAERLALPAIAAGIVLRLVAALLQRAFGGNKAAGGVE